MTNILLTVLIVLLFVLGIARGAGLDLDDFDGSGWGSDGGDGGGE